MHCVSKLKQAHHTLGRHFNSVDLNNKRYLIINLFKQSLMTTLHYFSQVWHAHSSIKSNSPVYRKLPWNLFHATVIFLSKQNTAPSFGSRSEKLWRPLLKFGCYKKLAQLSGLESVRSDRFWQPENYKTKAQISQVYAGCKPEVLDGTSHELQEVL
jgi:hypothetical protein